MLHGTLLICMIHNMDQCTCLLARVTVGCTLVVGSLWGTYCIKYFYIFLQVSLFIIVMLLVVVIMYCFDILEI